MRKIKVLFGLVVLTGLLFPFDVPAQSLKPPYFQLGINNGANIFFGEDGYKLKNQFTFNMLNFELGYRFNTYHEAGISAGRNDKTYKEFLGININGQDTTFMFNFSVKSRTFNWYGIYYKFHLEDYLYAGIKIGHSPEEGTYHEFSIGKDYEVAKNFCIRLNFAACIITDDLFHFKNTNSNTDNLGITLGVNYHF